MIKKIAQPPYWSKVKQGIQTLGLNPEIISMLNSNKCVWDTTPSASNPNAIAYVSSEDANDDGKIDKIHFVINKFPPTATDEEIKGLVSQIAKTLVHEYGHIQDFDAERGMFPGGEGVAEAAERAAEGMINQRLESFSKINTTNKKIGIDNVIKRNSIGEYKMQKELIKLANHLDNIGHRDLADKLDNVIKQAAVTGGGEGFTATTPADSAAARRKYGFEDDADWNALSQEEQIEVVDTYVGVARGGVSEGQVELGTMTTSPAAVVSGGGEGFTASTPADLVAARKRYGYEDDADFNALSQEEQEEMVDTYVGIARGGAPEGTVTLGDIRYGTDPSAESRDVSRTKSNEVDDNEVDDNEVDDFVLASNSSQDRIDKLAELMSREFTTNVPGTFSR